MFRYSKLNLMLVATAFLTLSSCVAKKKYLEMETYRNRAEKRVRELTNDVKQLETDFDAYKNDFHYNNSVKDIRIDSLGKKIIKLNSNLSSKNENIEDRTFSFQIEKRRLNQLLAEKDKEIQSINSQIKLFNSQISKLQEKEQNAQIELQNLESKNKSQDAEIKNQTKKLKTIGKEIETRNTEIKQLKNSLAEKDEQIESLTNQVKLLKSQFGK